MTPITKPTMATRNVNHIPSSTTWPTVRLDPRSSGSPKRLRMVHTWGIDRSSVWAGRSKGPMRSFVAWPNAL